MDAGVTVVDVADVGPDTVALTFDSPAAFDADPGQFVRLGATVDGETYQRFYTVSSPDAADTFEVTVEVAEEGGPFSAHLAALDIGDELEMSGPFGDASYDGSGRAVVLAGGPGVGPAVAIGEAALSAGESAAVVYRDDEPIHRERLDALAEAGVTVAVLDGQESLTAAVDDALTGADDEAAFVYGFEAFVADAQAAIEAADAAPPTVHVESFG
ncbi:MAG: FAD-dependent oxidoreductase [Halolamina sp.]